MSLQNVTIDDGVNSTAATILYSPPLCNGSGWTVNEGRGFGGSYRFCSSSNKSVTPSASLSFTGVGVYYVSPYFPGGFMTFTLDGVESQDISLSAPTGQTSNSTATAIMWSATNLNDTQHLLELRPNNGSTTLNVDAFIITQLQNNATATGSAPGNATQIPPTGGIPGLADLPALASPEQSSRTTRISMGLGITFGALSFMIFIGIAFFLWRRSRGMKEQFYWSKPVPPIRSVEEDSDAIGTRPYTQDDSYQQSPVTPRAGQAALPMRTLPSVAHGSFTTQPDFELGDARSENGANGWASPAFSNTHLISKQASSSQGHGDDTASVHVKHHHPPVIKFEPVRTPAAPTGPRVRSGSSSTQSHGEFNAPISRNTTVSTTRLEPVRAHASQSGSPSTSFSPSAFGGAPAVDHDNRMVSRSTTFNSTRFEPVRRGHIPSNS